MDWIYTQNRQHQVTCTMALTWLPEEKRKLGQPKNNMEGDFCTRKIPTGQKNHFLGRRLSKGGSQGQTKMETIYQDLLLPRA